MCLNLHSPRYLAAVSTTPCQHLEILDSFCRPLYPFSCSLTKSEAREGRPAAYPPRQASRRGWVALTSPPSSVILAGPAMVPLYFAVVALSLGLASLPNARLVMRFGMNALARWVLSAIVGLTLAALGIALLAGGLPPLWFLMAYLMVTFFCIGILFGNMNALAMKPLGHIAGIGAAVIGSLSTLISIPIGVVIGQSFNGTVVPLVAGMAILAGLSIVIVHRIGAE